MNNSQNIPTMQEHDSTAAGPLVTFVITYTDGNPDLLSRCISTLMSLSLSENEREVIVMDNGSSFPPIGHITEWLDHLTYMRIPRTSVAEARNTGFMLSGGKFVQLLSSDEVFVPAGFEHVLDILRFNEPDIITYSITTRDEPISTPYRFEGPFTGTDYMHSNSISSDPSSYIFSRALLCGQTFVGTGKSADEDFSTRLVLKAERLYTTDTAAVCRMNDDGGVAEGSNGDGQLLDDTEKSILQLVRLWDSVPYSERQALQSRVAQLSMDYLKDIIRLCPKEWKPRTERLAKDGLFPLPKRNYTRKYEWFRRLSSSFIGRKILFAYYG